MTKFNFDTPEGRYLAIAALGPAAYNAAHDEHLRNSAVCNVNGYDIRRVVSKRFGVLFSVDGANAAFTNVAQAQNHAHALKQKEAK